MNDKANKRTQTLGATGMYPKGQMSEDVAGQIKVGFTHNRRNVLIDLGKPVASLGLSPIEALELAELIRRHAATLLQ